MKHKIYDGDMPDPLWHENGSGVDICLPDVTPSNMEYLVQRHNELAADFQKLCDLMNVDPDNMRFIS